MSTSKLKELKWQIDNKERELKDLKEQQEKFVKEQLLASLSNGNYYAITDDEEWSDYQTIYIIRYNGKNIYIEKSLSSWHLKFDGPVIKKSIVKSKEISYELKNNDFMYIYDELSIRPVDVTELQKAIRKFVNQF